MISEVKEEGVSKGDRATEALHTPSEYRTTILHIQSKSTSSTSGSFIGTPWSPAVEVDASAAAAGVGTRAGTATAPGVIVVAGATAASEELEGRTFAPAIAGTALVIGATGGMAVAVTELSTGAPVVVVSVVGISEALRVEDPVMSMTSRLSVLDGPAWPSCCCSRALS